MFDPCLCPTMPSNKDLQMDPHASLQLHYKTYFVSKTIQAETGHTNWTEIIRDLVKIQQGYLFVTLEFFGKTCRASTQNKFLELSFFTGDEI